MPCPFNGPSRFVTIAVIVTGAVASPSTAQVALFPRVEPFELPVAHPRPAAFFGRLLSLGTGESRYGAGREAEAGLGAVIPVLALAQGRVPVTLGLGVAMAARFSLDDPRTALVSDDWLVGLHLTTGQGPWRVDLHLFHESSHLGDEYGERFDVARLDWTREVAAVWLRRSLGHAAVLASLSHTLIDELDLPGAAAALGLDYRRPGGRLLGADLRPVAGVMLEATEYSRWRLTTTGRLGVELGNGGRTVSVSLVGLDGLSSQRQFYLERSRYVGLELRFDL